MARRDLLGEALAEIGSDGVEPVPAAPSRPMRATPVLRKRVTISVDPATWRAFTRRVRADPDVTFPSQLLHVWMTDYNQGGANRA